MNTAKFASVSICCFLFVFAASAKVKYDIVMRLQERDYKGHVIHKTKTDNKTVDAQGAIMHENGKAIGRVPKDGKHYDRTHGIFILKYGEHPYQPFAPTKGSGASVYQFVTGKP